ncbi:tetratricopeptide repeat protein [Myxosarcina sp. GI1]|uniref:tetratricopeptide repeat protein n=1 Tax=Myxosarcina sp. GI1 TaxID=1541065 RepID=UPI00056C2B14|nr:tetratricopeptide repeat protein [Myxosarcina sp. GI1]
MDYSYLDRAILECEKAIETDRDRPEVWQTAFKNLGNILQGVGQFDVAVSCHSLASEERLDLAEAYGELGQLYLATENHAAALKSFENALKYQPDSLRSVVNLAQLYGKLGKEKAEILAWYRATKIKPDFVNPSGYYKLGKAFQEQKDLEKAIACYQQALSDDKLYIRVSYELGAIYCRQQQLERAKSCYQQILAADSSQALAQHQLGRLYLHQQCVTEAIDCFQKTIECDPEFSKAYYDLVKTYLSLQRWDEAIATCNAIINIVEEYPWAYSFLGSALKAKGKNAAAAQSFQKACQGRGWQECVTHNYYFTHDVFSEQIPIWTEQLQPLVADKNGIDMLEVGSYQGMSACWLLDKLLVHPQARLTCVEEKSNRHLRENLAKTGSEAKVTILEGNLSSQLTALSSDSFDIINLYDRHKLADRLERNAILVWKLLKSGGILVFNDYGWVSHAYPQLNPTQGIDKFLSTTKNLWQVIYHSPTTFQLIIRKL